MPGDGVPRAFFRSTSPVKLDSIAPMRRRIVIIIACACAGWGCLWSWTAGAESRWFAAVGEPHERYAVRILEEGDYFDTLLDAIDSARHDIVLSYFLFKTNGYPSNRPDRIVASLGEAVKRCVPVAVVLERGRHSDSGVDRSNRATAERLRRVGVTIRYDGRRRTNHSKIAVIDGRYVFIGSHNLTNSALKYNHELSVLIDSPVLADDMLVYIDSLK